MLHVTAPANDLSFQQLQLRYCPALAKKPVTQSKPEDEDKPKPNPFLNPSPDLLVTSIPQQNPRHIIVLNKYPVITRHFILATKAVKAQTDLLEEDDLARAYSCLKAWQQDGTPSEGKLFAFFNSGEYSGASQPHRHVQFLPVKDMYAGEDRAEWKPLIEYMTLSSKNEIQRQPISSLPFLHFAHLIPDEPSSSRLFQIYERLYKAAEASVFEQDENRGALPHYTSGGHGRVKISYNLAITTSTMAICPRMAEGAHLFSNEEEDSMVSLNGTILAGTLMVKAEREWNALRGDATRLEKLLGAIGVSRDRDDSSVPLSYL